MSKRKDEQAACAACGRGRLRGVARNIKGIRDAHAQIEAMARTGDYVPILDVVEKMARHFVAGRKASRTNEESETICRVFVDAVLRLHDVVFDREKSRLFHLAAHREGYVPLTAHDYSRQAWDGDPESWESPKFFRARGFARIVGRKPPMFRLLGIVHVDMERYSKEGLLAVAEAGDDLEQMPCIEVLSCAAECLSGAMLCYEKFWRIYGGEQMTLACLRVLVRIATAVNKFAEMSFPIGYRGIEELQFDMLCRFVVPDLPDRNDAEGRVRYVHECRVEIERGVARLCEAEPILFNEWLYRTLVCIETCVKHVMRFAPDRAGEMFALAAHSIGRIWEYTNRASFRAIFPPRLLLPIGDSTGYTLSDTILCMRKIANRGVTTKGSGARERMLKKLRECTVEFLYAQHFERGGGREKLIDEYRKALVDFANRATEMSLWAS